MNEDTVKGSTKETVGKMEETVGHTIGNTGMEMKGKEKQVEGKTQKLFGETREKVHEVADWGRENVVHYPLTAIAATFALGIVFGAMVGGK